MSSKRIIQRRVQKTLVIIICTLSVLCGCSKEQPTMQGSTPTADQSNPSNTPTNSNVSDSKGIPSGVEIKKVIKEEALKNNYFKKVELLTDGGKRITITNSKNEIVIQHLEYDGIILSTSGNQVTVQVKNGGEQTLTIPSDVVIEDDEKLGLNKGVEIEWTVDTDGRIQSVELDD